MVDVHANLDTVTARCAGRIVARHPRAWTRQRTITDPAHVTSAARLRAALGQPPRQVMQPTDEELAGLVRDLADYDTRFGIDFGVA